MRLITAVMLILFFSMAAFDGGAYWELSLLRTNPRVKFMEQTELDAYNKWKQDTTKTCPNSK